MLSPTYPLEPVCPGARQHRCGAQNIRRRRLRLVPGLCLLLAAYALLAMPLPVRAAETDPVAAGGRGRLVGEVVDAETGVPVSGVTVTLRGPEPGDGGVPLQESRVTGGDGDFDFGEVPVGSYQLDFDRSEYRPSSMTDFPVTAGELNRADFPLSQLAAAPTDDGGDEGPADVEEFVVKAEKVEDLMTLRIDSDQLLNVVGAEEFSKFSAGNVAEVLERVAGVTVAEGQFAIIRGLEDRYGSTVLDGAAVPSPDPNSQSVQLDLFPSEVVGSVGVVKTFSPELPSNSAGGAIDIKTHTYPDELELTFKTGVGYNQNAQDLFIKQEGHTDVDQIVNGLPQIGTTQNGQPLYETREQLQARGVRFVGGNPIGSAREKNGNFFDDLAGVVDNDYLGSIGGKKVFGGREFRFKGVFSRETDYETAEGFKSQRVPAPPEFSLPSFGPPIFIPVPPFVIFPVIPGKLIQPGDLTLGELNRYKGQYDLTLSTRERQTTGYAGLGFDLDREGDHKIDASFLWTRIKVDTAQLEENGFLPGLDYPEVARSQIVDQQIPTTGLEGVAPGSFIGDSFRDNRQLEDGAIAFDSFYQSSSFETDRDLWVAQVNGDHDFGRLLPGFKLNWAWNTAETTQQESALGMSYFYEPCGFASLVPCPAGVQQIEIPTVYPTTPQSLGTGSYAVRNDILLSANSISEKANFYRVDAEYEMELAERTLFTLAGGVWVERANRDVLSAFLESPTVTATGDSCVPGASSQFVCQANNAPALGEAAYEELAFANGTLGGMRNTSNQSSRSVDAWHMRGKLALWDTLDMLGGLRRERLVIESLNDPFLRNPLTGDFFTILGGPQTFPSRFVEFDRIDNPFPTGPDGLTQPPPRGFVFNDEILGTGVVPGRCIGDDGSRGSISCVDLVNADQLRSLFNGRIDAGLLLPSAGFTLRPFEGLILRGAWSKTVARPSFRELGYYVTVEPATNDLIVGNPTLQLSPVESYDARLEYTWGFRGDLVAVSYFRKRIENPIEAIRIRDPLNQELTASGIFQTFFNNPNTGKITGVELEARKSFGFLELLEDYASIPMPDWLEYLSVGGNYTYIKGEVARTEIERERAAPFFEGSNQVAAQFDELAPTRRLFRQPNWIANLDVTFDNPDWGIKATVAYFAISDVLDSAGSATISNTGRTLEYVPDRYTGAYQDLRATVSKTFLLPQNIGELSLRATAKNLLNSPRRLIYDPGQTTKQIVEQELQTGLDYSFSITFRKVF